MASKDDGIYIPKRLVFIMIFVSLCVNVFFLLMGILIGKDDVKYDPTTGPTNLPTETIAADQVDADPLDVELSMFDEKAEQERRKPIAEDYLPSEDITSKPERKPTVTTQAEPPPRQPTVVQKPKPTNTKPDPKPQTPGAKGSFWIQVLAISDKAKAEEFKAKVIRQGYTARVFSQGGFHKVRVGPYDERTVANRQKERINKEFSVKGWVVAL